MPVSTLPVSTLPSSQLEHGGRGGGVAVLVAEGVDVEDCVDDEVLVCVAVAVLVCVAVVDLVGVPHTP